jgi:protein-L-isoaspartate(D-aspartate) O-methyltransferase
VGVKAVDEYRDARRAMVAEQLAAQGIRCPRVLAAMRDVPRHLFVPQWLIGQAYDDTALGIDCGQTISQPYIVARMTEALELPTGEPLVLEVGTGSGYQAAVLAALGARVVTVEWIPALAERARAALATVGLLDRVRIVVGDGTAGVEDAAPYDGMLVTAGGAQIPRALLSQLRPGAALVLPLGEPGHQELVRLHQGDEGWVEGSLGGCRFVPLRGPCGWEEE